MVTRFRLADVGDVSVVEEKGSDGDPVYALRIVLSDGRELRLQGHSVPGEAPARERAGAIRRFLNFPVLDSPPREGRIDGDGIGSGTGRRR